MTSSAFVAPLPVLERSPAHLHRTLASFARARLVPSFPDARRHRFEEERRLLLLEERFLAAERARVATWASEAPDDPEEFVQWFDALLQTGPGQGDPLFPWLEHTASLDQMRWFLGQEVAGEAGFDDLVALTQVRLPVRAKLEMARNYWDEMGQGKEVGMHGPMLARLARFLHLDEEHVDAVWEAAALGNLMTGLALDRRCAFHAVGALGVIELTAPGRAAKVNRGLQRLGVSGHERMYYALHATLDVKHYAAWRDEVLHTLVDEDPRTARPMAEGALMRLTAGARCFARYRAELGVPA